MLEFHLPHLTEFIVLRIVRSPSALIPKSATPADPRQRRRCWASPGPSGGRTRTQGFSDCRSGYLWIVPITCLFRECKRSLSVVFLGCLDGFCDRKVSKRSSARCDHERSCTVGLLCGIPLTWRSPTARQPGAVLDESVTCAAAQLCPQAGVW